MFPVLRSKPDTHKLLWKFYGKNAVMAHLEPNASKQVHEIGLYGEVMAPTQKLANAIANCARVGVLHGAYTGQVATAGNFASPGTPLELSAGPCCEFTVYHLMDVEDPSDFPMAEFEVGPGGVAKKSIVGSNGHMNGSLVGAQNGHEAWERVEEVSQLDELKGESLARMTTDKQHLVARSISLIWLEWSAQRTRGHTKSPLTSCSALRRTTSLSRASIS